MTSCRVCGKEEDLAQPFIDGACFDCHKAGKAEDESTFVKVKHHIIHISVAKTSRISAYINGVIWILAGLIWSVGAIVSAGAVGPIVIVFPLVFGLLGCLFGYVGTAISCALYNFLAEHIGGIEIQFESDSKEGP